MSHQCSVIADALLVPSAATGAYPISISTSTPQGKTGAILQPCADFRNGSLVVGGGLWRMINSRQLTDHQLLQRASVATFHENRQPNDYTNGI